MPIISGFKLAALMERIKTRDVLLIGSAAITVWCHAMTKKKRDRQIDRQRERKREREIEREREGKIPNEGKQI